MLTWAAAAVTAAVVAGALVMPSASPAIVVDCPPDLPICIVVVEQSGSPATGSNGAVPSSATERMCVIRRTGESVPCFSENWGWFNNSDGCYYQLRAPQPPSTDPIWAENFPGGAVYVVTCAGTLGTAATNTGWVWLPTAPEGFGAVLVTPGELAARAVDSMQLTGAVIGRTPLVGSDGLVGVPVWLWTEVSASSWGPNTATASVPGLSVTATAQARQIVWDMGDGTAETCTNPGTPYYTGGVESPTCDHVYELSSAGQPDDAFGITATTTWDVAWSGGAASGVLTVTRSSTTTVRIGELQVLVTS